MKAKRLALYNIVHTQSKSESWSEKEDSIQLPSDENEGTADRGGDAGSETAPGR